MPKTIAEYQELVAQYEGVIDQMKSDLGTATFNNNQQARLIARLQHELAEARGETDNPPDGVLPLPKANRAARRRAAASTRRPAAEVPAKAATPKR